MKTVFLRALEADDKAATLRTAIHEPPGGGGNQRFEVDAASFAAVPRSPFAYWASDGLRRPFKELPSFEAEGRTTKQGLATADDFRWLRAWWECTPGQDTDAFLVPITKGGTFSPFYADVHLAVRWGQDGRWIKEWKADQLSRRLITANNSRCWNESYYFRQGLTWPLRSQRGLSVRPMPAGVVFGQKGSAAFVLGDTADQLLTYLAVFCSSSCLALVQMQMAFGAYDVGVIARTPVPDPTSAQLRDLPTFARRAWSLKRSLDTQTETSHAFTLPALLQVEGDTLAACAAAWVEQTRATETELATIQAEIDDRCFELYGIDDADRRAVTEGFGGVAGQPGEPSEPDNEADTDTDEEDGAESSADVTVLAAELVSWAVGVAFGRFDVRLATGARPLPPEPEPFDPLPVCSPGMLTGEDDLPLASAPAGYPLSFLENGILADDPGNPHDLTVAVREVFDEAFGESADAFWQKAAALLDPKGQNLRAWLTSGFFAHHLKRHSKSRRKAPILWQLGVPSGRYSVWLYAHRLTRDSFFQIQNEVVAPKLAHEERRLMSLVQSTDGDASANERKEIAAQEAFVEELRALLDEIKGVAPLWNPTLDDGVVLTMAPLWPLVPQHKPWQRELKGKWDELAAGKYDWAHLAMHLWPGRVVPKCAADRSLAIAHGLEEVFWVERDDGKWEPRSAPTRPVEELVRERSSAAVDAALDAARDRPAITGVPRRRAQVA